MSDEAIASQFDRMRGRVLGLIESWGLPDSQERGCKAIFKSLSYDTEAEIKNIVAAASNKTGEEPTL